MAVSGLPEACENHAKWIAKLALDMMDMAKCVQMGVEPVVSQIQHQNNNCYEMDYFFFNFFFTLALSHVTYFCWIKCSISVECRRMVESHIHIVLDKYWSQVQYFNNLKTFWNRWNEKKKKISETRKRRNRWNENERKREKENMKN